MEKKDLRIIFMGTPDFAVATLQSLLDHDYNVVAVVTQPDKPVGRHHEQLQPSPVKRCALANGIPVLQPERMKDPQFLDQLRGYRAHLQVVVAFRMLPEAVWAMPPFGTFNVHAALLPLYRGAAPIQWAVIRGETQTGVTTFFLDHDIDTGRIILQRTLPVPDDADAGYVYDRLMHLGAQAALDTVDLLLRGDGIVATVAQSQLPSPGELPLAPKIFKDTCRIFWHQPAKTVYDFVRGLAPHPGAWTQLHLGDTVTDLKIWRTAKTTLPPEGAPGTLCVSRRQLFVNCADAQLQILQLQPSGKRSMTAQDFINGTRNLDSARCE